MGRFFYMPTITHFGIISLLLFFTPSLPAAINIEWRPDFQVAQVDDIIDLHLYFVSDSEFEQSISALRVVFTWDASRLHFLGHIDPCTESPCATGTFNWMQSWFPTDENLDRLNEDCGDDLFCASIPCDSGCPENVLCNEQKGFCEPAGVPYNDGDAKFEALSPLGGGDNSAQATPEGLWVTTFQFRVISSGSGKITLENFLGSDSPTLIVDGDIAGLEVTGTLGPAAEVLVGGCLAPTVEAIGSRYLAITPAFTESSVALVVTGDANEPAVDCVSLFVQQDGTLGEEPFFQSSELWSTVLVGDRFIQPELQYQVHTDCRMIVPDLVSEQAIATTAIWGDINDDGSINFSDILRVFDGIQSVFQEGVVPESMDIIPCTPDGIIDQQDLDAVEDVVNGLPFPCREPCAPLPPISDWPIIFPCLQGPNIPLIDDCYFYDFDLDSDVDMKDVSEFSIRPPDF